MKSSRKIVLMLLNVSCRLSENCNLCCSGECEFLRCFHDHKLSARQQAVLCRAKSLKWFALDVYNHLLR